MSGDGVRRASRRVRNLALLVCLCAWVAQAAANGDCPPELQGDCELCYLTSGMPGYQYFGCPEPCEEPSEEGDQLDNEEICDSWCETNRPNEDNDMCAYYENESYGSCLCWDPDPE